jgi:PAS domain S-box-containing protein
MKFYKAKLKSKIVAGVLVIAAIVGAALIYFFYNLTLKVLSESSRRELVYGTENSAAMIKDVFDKDIHSADVMSLDNNFVQYLSGQQIVQNPDILLQLQNFKIKGDYYAATLVSATGTVVVSTEPSFVGLNVYNRQYFRTSLEGNSSVMMAFGILSKKPRYYFSSPVKNSEGNFLGAVVLVLEGSVVDEMVSQIANNNEKIMLTDTDGIILSSNDTSRIYKSLGKLDSQKLLSIKDKNVYLDTPILPLTYDLVLSRLQNYSKTVTVDFFDDEDGVHETVVLTRLHDLPFFVVSEYETENVFAATYETAFLVSMIILLAILIKFLLITFLIEKQLKPISELNNMAKGIGAGNFNQKNIIKSNDELSELGSLLERVSDQLSELYGSLEQKVKERTTELEKSNRRLVEKDEKLNAEKIISERLTRDLLKFKLAVDSASEQVVITDPEGIVVYGNKAMEKITGYSLDQVIGTKAGKLWSFPMPSEYYKEMWKTIKHDKKPFQGEIKNRRKNGEVYEAKVSITPVLDKTGEIFYFVGLERDITVEKNIDRSKTEFVSLASHQLRTPLTTISWYAEILKSGDAGKLNKKQTTFINEIYTGNKRMIDLVNMLLNVSRIEMGNFAVNPEQVDINDILKSVLRELTPQIKSKKISIADECDKKVKKMDLDPNLLRIVFQNLITNAVKYTGKGGKVVVSSRVSGKYLEVSVSDNGIGIPEDQKNKIFSKLFRASNAQEQDSSGSGLGLYIVKSIIEESGGKIWFESEEKKGTTFYFTIPLTGMKKKDGSKPLS